MCTVSCGMIGESSVELSGDSSSTEGSRRGTEVARLVDEKAEAAWKAANEQEVQVLRN